MTFGFVFGSVNYGAGFGSVRVLAHFLLSGSGSVRFLAKPGF